MTIVNLLLFIGVPLGASLLVYERVRSRGSSAVIAGCVSIVVGVVISFAIAAVMLLIMVR